MTGVRDEQPPRATSVAPVIVLTTVHSGAQKLLPLLNEMAGLACTSGTGLIPLCAEAAQTWQRAEARPGSMSSLAIASIRAMASSVITTILVRKGKQRWCEISTAPPSATEAFLRAFPGTRVLCLHRSCPDVIYNAIHATGWGLASPVIAPFIAAHPASSAASVGAYWAARTEELLTFEAAHPGACHRFRFEDLAERPETIEEMLAFLGAVRETPPRFPMQAQDHIARSGMPDGILLPVEQIPPPLLDEINRLMTKLSYPIIPSPCP